MAGQISLKKMENINTKDSFFDLLKSDYPDEVGNIGLEAWFGKKTVPENIALVFEDEAGIEIFVILEQEEREIQLQDCMFEKKKRMKISNICVADRCEAQQAIEGAIGVLLWKWQQSDCNEIYVTIIEKYQSLICKFELFGFIKSGINRNGENVYFRFRDNIDFSNPYKAFPFIRSDFGKAGYIIMDDSFHDTMFAYSESDDEAGLQSKVGVSVVGGLSKIYVGGTYNPIYNPGEPVLIYRKYTQGAGKRYRSCITSFCVVTDVIKVKNNYKHLMSFDELCSRIGDKAVFDRAEMLERYRRNKNVVVIEMLYYGYFGAGNNINMDWLHKNGCWARSNQYPTNVKLSLEQFKKILAGGKIDVSNVVIE